MSLVLHQRYEIIFLAKDIYGPKFSQTKIVKIIKCHHNTVKLWLDRWEETKDLSDRSRPGPPRSTAAQEDQLMIDLTTEEMDAISEMVQQELEKKKVVISNRTIRRRLHDAGLQYMRPLSKALLNEQHRQRRVQWARDEEEFRLESGYGEWWNNDSASYFSKVQLAKIWWTSNCSNGEVLTQSQCLWVTFLNKDSDAICCITHDLNSEFLCNHIYRNALLSSARHHFARSLWFLLEDNGPKHRSNYTSAWKSAHQHRHITMVVNESRHESNRKSFGQFWKRRSLIEDLIRQRI